MPGTKLAQALSEAERKLILDNWSISSGLTDEQLKVLAEAKKPGLRMSLADWEDFGGWGAATGNHAGSDSKLESRADALETGFKHWRAVTRKYEWSILRSLPDQRGGDAEHELR